MSKFTVRVFAILILSSFSAEQLAAQQLSASESNIASWVDSHAGEAVELLERIVNVNSGTMNYEGVREVGRIFRGELDALGFQTRWIGMPVSRALDSGPVRWRPWTRAPEAQPTFPSWLPS